MTEPIKRNYTISTVKNTKLLWLGAQQFEQIFGHNAAQLAHFTEKLDEEHIKSQIAQAWRETK